MAVTAFFESQNSILSIAQYLSILGFQEYSMGQEITSISPLAKEVIESDARCPMCKCSGATFVSATKDKSRQTYLRFQRKDGEDAHSQLCDYSETNNVRALMRDLAYPQSSKAGVTYYIDQFTSKAIAAGVLGQYDILSFRESIYGILSDQPLLYSLNIESLINARDLIINCINQKYQPKRPKRMAVEDEKCRLIFSQFPDVDRLASEIFSKKIIIFNRSTLRNFLARHGRIRRPDFNKLTVQYDNARNVYFGLSQHTVNLKKLDLKGDVSPILTIICLLSYALKADGDVVKQAYIAIDSLPDLPIPTLGCALGFLPFKFYQLDKACSFFETNKTQIESWPKYPTSL